MKRAVSPSHYFPKPNLDQKQIGSELRSQFPESVATALIDFIETEGSLESCAALIERSPDFAPALPYRFLAAYIIGMGDVEREALQAMQDGGIISPFLIGFGHNLLISADNADYIITNGFQDLIAVRAAQILDGRGSGTVVYNQFATTCRAWAGLNIDNLLTEESRKIFIAPTMSESFLEKHAANLWISGLGYVYATGPDADTKKLKKAAIQTARQFYTPPLPRSEINPSTSGIILIYKVFINEFEQIIEADGSKSDRNKADEIKAWLEEIQEP
jgi:hypothetical protein